ncbi:MAG: CBS domain-containing protein [Mariprofundus sp.]|nr:CBS domain-containing protein [Mariprofundus sp.]
MVVSSVMVTEPQTCCMDEHLDTVLRRMHRLGLRMVPVLDVAGRVKGVLSTFSSLAHIVPDYIVSGDLASVSFAPDIGLLRQRYTLVADKCVAEVMELAPLMVAPGESLLSVASTLVGSGTHDYALVIDAEGRLSGLISAGDVIAALMSMTKDEK